LVLPTPTLPREPAARSRWIPPALAHLRPGRFAEGHGAPAKRIVVLSLAGVWPRRHQSEEPSSSPDTPMMISSRPVGFRAPWNPRPALSQLERDQGVCRPWTLRHGFALGDDQRPIKPSGHRPTLRGLDALAPSVRLKCGSEGLCSLWLR